MASFGCLWSAFGGPWADFGLLLTLLGALGLPLGVLWAPVVPFGMPLGSLWSSFGLPLAILGHMEPSWDSQNLRMIIDERGCNCSSKPVVLDERVDNSSKIIDIHYRQMCQIHGTVFKNQLFGTQPPEPAEPVEPAEVVSASAAQTLPSTRAGGQDDGSSTNSLKL